VPHFLTPLLAKTGGEYVLRHEASGRTLATTLETAFDSASRNRGLLGRHGLPPDTALIIAPCSSIHTCFMRFPIDVVFVRKDGTVARVRDQVGPWRAAIAFGGFAAIELAAGRAAAIQVRAGDRLCLERRA
jgi:uncharacterized membrane protein (UPF0127 family)